MSTKITLNPQWLQRACAAVAPTGEVALALVQGYPFTTFARVRSNGTLELPPAPWSAQRVRWDRFWDVRVFGINGEWHAWKLGNGQWYARLYAAPAGGEIPYGAIERCYALWGTDIDSQPEWGDWRRYSEERGAVVWAPLASPATLRIKTWLLLTPDEETGLMHATDAVIRGFCTET